MAWSLNKLQQLIRRASRSFYLPPIVIFIVMLGVTYWAWHTNQQTVNQDIQTTVNERTQTTENAISQRLGSYEDILVGGAGLFRGSEDVTRNEWHNFVDTFDIAHKLPGVQSIGYAKLVSLDQVPQLNSYLGAQGVTNFVIHPSSPPGDIAAPVVYLAPSELEGSGLGVNLWAEPSRQSAMTASRDQDKAVITPPLKPLLSKTDPVVFIMFYPQYKTEVLPKNISERQQDVSGFIFGGFRAPDFFTTLFPNITADTNTQFAVTSPEPTGAHLLYASPLYDKFKNNAEYQTVEHDLSLYGQTWHITYLFSKVSLATPQRRSAPTWALIIGLLMGFLMAEVIFLILKGRASELIAQKEMDVNLAKDELLSLASHQLRTPATTVKQYLGLVLQGFAGDITANQQELLEKAYAGNERQLYTINEMLHLAKIDSGRITLAKRQVNLTQIVKDIVDEQRTAIATAKHKLKLKLPKQPINVVVDEHMLGMAIDNILTNAIKYMASGGELEVGIHNGQEAVSIYVRDAGIGIKQSDMPKLFKLFSRLPNEMNQNISGTGVGLYLAKHLVEMHGGHIHVESQPNHGSTFTIVLPKKHSKRGEM